MRKSINVKKYAVNNPYIGSNIYKHKYEDEIVAWIREYFD